VKKLIEVAQQITWYIFSQNPLVSWQHNVKTKKN